jgi:hypothetical protein
MKRSIVAVIASAVLLCGCASDKIGVQKDEWVLLEVNPTLLEPLPPMVIIEQPKVAPKKLEVEAVK